MDLVSMCLAMFAQLYPQDAKKITETTNNINAMARITMAYSSRLYFSELDVNHVMAYLRPPNKRDIPLLVQYPRQAPQKN